jgi:hypothetical protein
MFTFNTLVSTINEIETSLISRTANIWFGNCMFSVGNVLFMLMNQTVEDIGTRST